MIGDARRPRPVSITGLGCKVPDRVVTNDELAKYVDTSDEWIIERTGIRERRIAADEEALSDLALPACREALAQAGLDRQRHRPDHRRDGDAGHGVPVDRRDRSPTRSVRRTRPPTTSRPAAPASCTRSPRPTGCSPAGWRSGRSSSAATSSRGSSTGPTARRSCSSATARGRSCSRRSPEQGFLGFELGADGAGGENLWLPGSGSRLFEDPEQFVKMNGREVFKFATRILVQSAEDILAECEVTIDDVDLYIPHQANVRIIDHATRKLGVPSDRVVINVDRYGNTSSGSIPLALADAAADGRLRAGPARAA